MAKFRMVYTNFWRDPIVEEMTPEERYIFLYLLTNDHTTSCGIYEISPKTASFETGYTKEAWAACLDRLQKLERIKVSGNEVYILNWVVHNTPKSQNTQKGIVKELSRIKEKDFTSDYLAKCSSLGVEIEFEAPYKPLTSPLQAPTGPLTSPLQAPTKPLTRGSLSSPSTLTLKNKKVDSLEVEIIRDPSRVFQVDERLLLTAEEWVAEWKASYLDVDLAQLLRTMDMKVKSGSAKKYRNYVRAITNWIVQPHAPKRKKLDRDKIREETLAIKPKPVPPPLVREKS